MIIDRDYRQRDRMIDRQKDRQIDRQTDTHSHTHTLSRIHTHTDTIPYNYKFCQDSSLDS